MPPATTTTREVTEALPIVGRFIERVGFPSVVSLLLIAAFAYGIHVLDAGVHVLDANTAAMRDVKASVDNNTTALKAIFK